MPDMPARRRPVGRGGGLLETLHPVDGALHHGIEALHAEARAVDAAKGERVDHLAGERARVDLDGDLGRGRHEEGLPERSHQIHEGFGRHDGRRAAAEMDVVDLDAAIDLARYQIDFTAQRRGVDGDRVVAADHRGVAAAIPAHRAAERHVQIERRGGMLRNGLAAIRRRCRDRSRPKNAARSDSWCIAAIAPGRSTRRDLASSGTGLSNG